MSYFLITVMVVLLGMQGSMNINNVNILFGFKMMGSFLSLLKNIE